MNKLLMLIALGSTSFVFGDWYPNQECMRTAQNLQQPQRSMNQPSGSFENNRNMSGQWNSNRDGDMMHNNAYARQNDNDDDDEDDGDDADDTLTKSIRDSLSSQGLQLIFLEIDDGHVTLDGAVDSDEKKNNIERSVRKINGVNNVKNNIHVGNKAASASNANQAAAYSDANLERSEKKFPNDTAASKEDRILNAKIRDKISSGWFSTVNETLLIKTNNGAVLITGVVDKPEDVKSLGEKISSVEGVKSLDNKLTTKSQ